MLKDENQSNFGGKLKSKRETMGLSLQEAAARLHLSPRFITLLENENLQTCTLPPIYLRGYLRSYSRLLGIPENEIASVLETLNPTPPPWRWTRLISHPWRQKPAVFLSHWNTTLITRESPPP